MTMEMNHASCTRVSSCRNSWCACCQIWEHVAVSARYKAPGDAVVDCEGVYHASFVADHPRIHHREQCFARGFCGNRIAAFAFLDQHENLQIARRTSACERTCGRTNDHGAQAQGRYSDLDRAVEQVLSHGGYPG